MKVAINTLVVGNTDGGGKTFLTNLVRQMAAIDFDATYYLFVSRYNENLFPAAGDNFKPVSIPGPSKNRFSAAFTQQFLIPYYLAKYKIDVLLSYGNIATLFPGCKQVVIVDGAQTIRGPRRRHAPDSVSKARAMYFDIMLPLSLKRASGVITVSNYMKQELIRSGHIQPENIAVIYEGIDLDFFSSTKGTVIGFDLPRPYLLFLSDIYKHKKADKLIEAFSILKKHYEIPHKLVIVGRDRSGLAESLQRLASKLGVFEETIFTGPIPHNEIAGIYRNADVFVHPSAFESFGLPVLEAMASGIPVIGSNRTAIPEIVGDAGLIVDSDDVEALANSIYSVITDQHLRDSLIKKGYERVSTFNGEIAARETGRVCEIIYRDTRPKFSMTDSDLRLVYMGRFPGRRVLTWHAGLLYVSRKYTLWRGDPESNEWEFVARYRPDWTRKISSVTRLGGRLRRDGFYSLAVLPDGALVAILPKGIAICPPGEKEFQVTWHVRRGTRPLALAITPSGAIYWGEYFNNPQRDDVHIYGSTDGGRTWDVVYTFLPGGIRHVHSITYDPFRDHLWMCTGDYGSECRIMRVSNDWKEVETVLEGSQQARTVRPIPTADGLCFATDSELEQNFIYRLNTDESLERLHPIDGPGMWSCQVGPNLFMSSDVEPSKVNTDPFASLYGSREGTSWSKLIAWRKDPWHKLLFQFGNIILPRGRNDTNFLAATGMAVRREDDVMHLWRVE